MDDVDNQELQILYSGIKLRKKKEAMYSIGKLCGTTVASFYSYNIY